MRAWVAEGLGFVVGVEMVCVGGGGVATGL